MSHRSTSVRVSLRALAAALIASVLAPSAHAQSTAFTYQGQLKSGGVNAQGAHDLRFRLFDAALGGVQLGATLCADNVPVVDGVFTTTIDFGAQFTSAGQRFVEIDVRRDTGVGCASSAGFLTLGPRQPLTAAPTAIHAKSAFALDSADGSRPGLVFVNNAGKVGINNATPFAQLDVHGDASFGNTGLFKVATDGRVTIGNVGNLSQLTIAGQDGIAIQGVQPFLTLRDATDPTTVFSARLQGAGGGFVFQSSNFIAGVANAFMHMDAGGRLGIGTTSNGPTLDVAGSIRCTTLTQTSSGAFKDDVAPLAEGLAELMRLRPVSYKWNDKAPPISRGKRDLGFIAEEVAQVLPDAVALDPCGAPAGIDYSRITVLAVKAIKEQQARHEADREEIRSLKERLEKLEAALSRKQP